MVLATYLQEQLSSSWCRSWSWWGTLSGFRTLLSNLADFYYQFSQLCTLYCIGNKYLRLLRQLLTPVKGRVGVKSAISSQKTFLFHSVWPSLTAQLITLVLVIYLSKVRYNGTVVFHVFVCFLLFRDPRPARRVALLFHGTNLSKYMPV